MGALDGIRVLVTRAAGQSSALTGALRAEGAESIEIPTIAIVPPRDGYAGLDHAIAHLKHFEWVAFTSANAVKSFCERCLYAGVHGAASGVKFAAVGTATGRALRDAGMVVSVEPERFVAEALVEAMGRVVEPGTTVLVPQSELAREVLVVGLQGFGADVTAVAAYGNEIPSETLPKLREVMSSQVLLPQVVTFTSSSSASNTKLLLDAAGVEMPTGVVLASIGPVTTQKMREIGWEPTVEARESTIAGLVAVLVGFYREKRG